MPQPALFDHRLRVAPEKPGVYIMKDAQNTVLYVGKASILRNRLRSYFGSLTGQPPKIRRMVSQLADFEFIVTDTEAEALILENTLIKRNKPHFNARLKDDKTYPYLKIDLNEEFPRVYITRQVAQDGARYFGPFATASSVRQTMDLIKKLFPYRSCTKTITAKVDFLLQRDRELLAIEVKSTGRYHTGLLKSLRKLEKLPGLVRRVLIYTGNRPFRSADGIDIWPAQRFATMVANEELWP